MSHADRPIVRSEDDRLQRGRAAEALSTLLAEPHPQSALFVGVFGEPGSGKTSLLHLLRGRVVDRSPTVWLDAWEHAQPEVTLWRKLLFALVEAFNDETHGLPAIADTEYRRASVRRELDDLTVCLFRSHQAAELAPAGHARPGAVELGLGGERGGLDPKRASGKETSGLIGLIEQRQLARYCDGMVALDEFRLRLRHLLGGDIAAGGRRMYIFVDHLDRCDPGEARRALEALRVCLDLPGGVFVLAFDPAALGPGGRAAGVPPRRTEPDALIDALIDLPFWLPPLRVGEVEAFVQQWAEASAAPEIGALAALLARGAPGNPRRIRRILSALRLLQRLDSRAELDLHAKLLALRASERETYEAILLQPARLKEREEAARKGAGGPAAVAGRGADRARTNAMLALAPWFEPLTEDRLSELVALNAAVG